MANSPSSTPAAADGKSTFRCFFRALCSSGYVSQTSNTILVYTDVYRHCHGCLTCASFGGGTRKCHPSLQPIPVGVLFERVGIDIMEIPQTCEGTRYVLVIVDYLSKWTEAFPMQDQSSETTAKLLVDHVICCHGVPNQLLSD